MEGGIKQAATTFMGAIGEGLTEVIEWIGEVITAVTSGSLSALLPLFGLGIAVTVVMLAVRVIRSFTWGA